MSVSSVESPSFEEPTHHENPQEGDLAGRQVTIGNPNACIVIAVGLPDPNLQKGDSTTPGVG